MKRLCKYLDGYGSITIIETGGWFIERCDKQNLEEGKDIFNFSKTYLLGLIQIEFICSKDFALKWKFIDRSSTNDAEMIPNPLSHRIETQ